MVVTEPGLFFYVQIRTLCSTMHIPRQWNVINQSKIKVSIRSPSVILWCQTCYRYFAKYTRCISAGCVIPSIFPITFFLSCPKWRSTPRGNHYCPSHRMEQSKKYHNSVDSNFPSLAISFTLGGLSQVFQIIFLFEPTKYSISSISQCPFIEWLFVSKDWSEDAS